MLLGWKETEGSTGQVVPLKEQGLRLGQGTLAGSPSGREALAPQPVSGKVFYLPNVLKSISFFSSQNRR